MTLSNPALSRARVRVSVCGLAYTIPWQPAGAWIDQVDNLSTLASRFAAPEIRDRLADRLWHYPETAAELRAESLRLVSEATGRRWWEAVRLMKTSVQHEMLGRLVLAGVDPWERSIGEWCAATYATCVKGADQKERLKFDFRMSVPPVGHEDAWDDDGDDPAAIEASLAGLFGTN